MISLYLLPDRTRLVKAEATSGKLKILAIDELSSYWDALTSSSSEINAETGISHAAMEFANLFREAKKAVRISGEEFYIVLPDSLFCLIDCVRETDIEDGLEQYVASVVERESESLSIVTPLYARPGAELFQTIFAISKETIQCIVDAAGEEGVTLSSIEPASVAFLRASGAYDHEYFFLEAFKDSAVFVAFSPVGGMFRMDAGIFAENQLLDMPEITGDLGVRQLLAELDMTADRTFPSANDGIQIAILTGQRREYIKFNNLAARLVDLSFAPDIFSETPSFESPQDWMASIGTFLQEVPEDAAVYQKKPTFLISESGNLLSKGMQTNAKLFRITQRVKRISRIFLLCGLIFLAVLIVPALYFNSIKVPKVLQERFDETQKELPLIELALSLNEQAKKEHCNPTAGFKALLAHRPDTMNFSRVKIGESVGEKDIWMEAELVSLDPVTFQDYVAAMSIDKTFQGASIIRIGTDASGYKTATVRVRKGEIASEK